MDIKNKIESLKSLSKNLTVLYVEDDSMLRAETSNFLKQIFSSVDFAVDGQEGIELYKKYFIDNNRYYDIVLTDIQMPNLNGIDMSKEIFEINKLQKIIIISAHQDKDYLLDVINIGVDGFIQKPLNIEQAIDVLYKTSMSFEYSNLQYFKALTEASIVSKTDTNGIITYVNDKFCKITGYTYEELIGQSHKILRHPETDDLLYKELWDTITSGKIWRERMKNRRKDGSTIICETTIIPLVDNQGKVKEYMAIRNDITNAINMKREIFNKNQEKIKYEKVKEAQKSFLLLFTHELKTPLNAIINFDKYIKKQLEKPAEIDRPKIISLLDDILKNSTNMLDHVTKILEISKLDAGKLNYDYSLFNVDKIMQDVLVEFRSLFEQNGIELTYKADKEALIYSDEQRVKQIFCNILSNAIKYGKDSIIITISSNNISTMVCIEDNGPGIKDKDAVFNLFAQEDEHMIGRKGKGTGIGLYFIKMLCKDLQIAYKIKDRDYGSGTSFLLSFNKPTLNKNIKDK